MSAGRRAAVGAVIWGGVTWWHVPSALHGAWAEALVLLAALVLVPLVIEIAADAGDDERTMRVLGVAERLQWPAAVLLVAAFWLAPGVGAAAAAMPWAVVLLLLATAGLLRLWRTRGRYGPQLGGEAGLIFAAVGAAWLMADRLGLRPLGFDPAIVLLTAVHFHYAGLILPVLTGKAVGKSGEKFWTKGVLVLVIAGVPAVAIGITATQLQVGAGVEPAAALVMVFGGFGVAVMHGILALRGRWPLGVRCLWLTAAGALVAGMLLAGLYGVRHVWLPWPWLDVPWMRALHGSANALGFGLPATLGWWLARERLEAEPTSAGTARQALREAPRVGR